MIEKPLYFGRFLAGMMALFGGYLLVAWASYTPLDNAWSIANDPTMLQNKAGAFGAWWIDLFFSFFGYVGNLIPFIVFFIPFFILTRQISLRSCWQVILLLIGISCFITGLSLLTTLLSPSFNWENGGGAIGGLLGQILYPVLNKAGLLFVAIVATFCGFLLGEGTAFFRSIVNFYHWVNAKETISAPIVDSTETESEKVFISGLDEQKNTSKDSEITQQQSSNSDNRLNVLEDTASIADILKLDQEKNDSVILSQLEPQATPEEGVSKAVEMVTVDNNYTPPNIIGLSKTVDPVETGTTEKNPLDFSVIEQKAQEENTEQVEKIAESILPIVSVENRNEDLSAQADTSIVETIAENSNLALASEDQADELENEHHAELVRQFKELERQKRQELEQRAKALNAEDTLKILLGEEQIPPTTPQESIVATEVITQPNVDQPNKDEVAQQPIALAETPTVSLVEASILQVKQVAEQSSVVEMGITEAIPQPMIQPQADEVKHDVVVTSAVAEQVEENRAETQKPHYKPYANSLIHPLLQPKTLEKPTTPMPSLALLEQPKTEQAVVTEGEITSISQRIEQQLRNFNIKATVKDVLIGPVVTRYDIELHPGVKASRVTSIETDLARSLMLGAIRIAEMIPGKPYVGIETPNRHRQIVALRDVLDSEEFRNATSPLSMALGKDISGKAVVVDLANMPHLLVAGSTGSGKSVGVNTMILSLLFKVKPDQVKFIMIDPKQVELNVYNDIPHLLTEVVTDMKKAANALRWCVDEMERRYQLLSVLRVRNIEGYNEKIEQAEEMGLPIPNPLWRPGDTMDQMPPALEKLPYIVVIVDEFADLMMIVGKSVEELIARLAQKARAIGIHLILATQRPSVDVITGLIKSNIPSRIAFTVASKIDSRTILDTSGAESLLGKGDMLYSGTNSNQLVRVHGAFMTTDEVVRVADDWRARGTPQYLTEILETSEDEQNDSVNRYGSGELDDRFDEAVALVLNSGNTSANYLQRRLGVGFPRAARILDQMEEQGIVSSPVNGKREILDRRGEY
ncbi:DNA translocase FtsK 4TM domain-containing protein [Mergibacter septicus]|nr:DNA translocase FtsK 4TM domain-containing protein [Mergibacter septicus]UTU47844.1 DNA translocase FtsK 4TM domain-containing protein [Mergibacter septicus]WMR96550.1 DNA translocase FtsK 4TM domain-containing protein [Mergibacter septicus]